MAQGQTVIRNIKGIAAAVERQEFSSIANFLEKNQKVGAILFGDTPETQSSLLGLIQVLRNGALDDKLYFINFINDRVSEHLKQSNILPNQPPKRKPEIIRSGEPLADLEENGVGQPKKKTTNLFGRILMVGASLRDKFTLRDLSVVSATVVLATLSAPNFEDMLPKEKTPLTSTEIQIITQPNALSFETVAVPTAENRPNLSGTINRHQDTKEAFTSHTQPENKVIPKDTREVIAKLTTFKECAGFVITALEGDDKVVPEPNGGIAKFGINSIAHPEVDVANLTREEAYQIAKKDYWDPIDADNLPENFRCVAMDTVFNHGVNGGKALIAKANLNPVALLEIRRQEYSDYVAANPERNAQYKAGWYNRISELYDQLDQPLDPESSLRPNSRKSSQFASPNNS